MASDPPTLDVSELSDEDRAFLELAKSLHTRIEALKPIFPPGPKQIVLQAIQRDLANLVAAVVAWKH